MDTVRGISVGLLFCLILVFVGCSKVNEQLAPALSNEGQMPQGKVEIMMDGQAQGIYTDSGQGEIKDCSSCHGADIKFDGPIAQEAKYRTAHWQINIEHDPLMTCAVCHEQHNPSKLRSVYAGGIKREHAYQLCKSCHSTQAREWLGGAHGKRISGWSDKRVIANCTSCHDAHTPRFGKRMPVALPTVEPTRVQKGSQ